MKKKELLLETGGQFKIKELWTRTLEGLEENSINIIKEYGVNDLSTGIGIPHKTLYNVLNKVRINIDDERYKRTLTLIINEGYRRNHE